MQLSYLTPGAAGYLGPVNDYVRFTMDHQLLNEKTWQNFVRVFTEDSDDADQGWRCEYWGKMMRGACLVYQYNRDEGLYRVLDGTVRDFLKTQREDGRFSSYSAAAQLHGWDVWGRKYVLTSLLHFYRICRDENLKKEILTALCRHADALIELVGPGKIDITQTSDFWEGVNSCSILDAVLDLYRETGVNRYLEFGEYIISTGGCSGGNLIELAEENKVMPWQYPEVKAYETISFFEGLLTYYEITGNRRYFEVVRKFTEAVNETDITVIGCAGCTHELFDHSAIRQTEYSQGIMQETCVTVTWMRMLGRLLLLTGEERYFDRMERSAWNGLYGSVNSHMLKQYSIADETFVDPLPFDSYSPLYNNRRGRGIGGFKRFRFGGYYGCCACIASAGIAVYPLCSVLKAEDGFVFYGLHAGTIREQTPSGKPVVFKIESEYPLSARARVRIQLEEPEKFRIQIRVPEFTEQPVLTVNEENPETLDRIWCSGDVVELKGTLGLRTEILNGRTAFFWGPLTLAMDSGKNSRKLTDKIPLEDGRPYINQQPQGDELIRLALPCTDGGEALILTDYASCGKNWTKPGGEISVWLNLN